MNTTIVRTCLLSGDFEAILKFSHRSRRVMRLLVGLTNDPDGLVAWRAVEALGIVTPIFVRDDAEFVRGHLRRLVWLLNDESGSIGWHAPEAMGEIIRSSPELFSSFIPVLISLLNLEEEDAVRFRAGTLWAIGRVSQVSPGRMVNALPQVFACLNDPQSQVRGLALWCLAQMKTGLPIHTLGTLRADPAQVELYKDRLLLQTSISELAGTLFL